MLSLIIRGKESVTAENVDVYLAPLLEELMELWVGVEAQDVSNAISNTRFSLRAMLMWCIHDFPAYGLASGQVTKGYKGCPECGPDVTSRRSTSLGKNVYLGHRRYLRRNHPYRRNRAAFDGSEDMRSPPKAMTGVDIKQYALERTEWLNASTQNRAGSEDDPVHRTGVKRLASFYELPYWEVFSIQKKLNSLKVILCMLQCCYGPS